MDQRTEESDEVVETLIVGAGFSGLCMAIKLKKAGRTSFLIVEKTGELGGTWSENKYPGCACDVPSHLYAFSFYQNAEWSRLFAPRAEILDYMNNCATHFGILPAHVRFHTRAASAEWDKAAALWRVELVSGDSKPYTILSRFLVCAVGPLNVPRFPSVPGIDRFRGHSLHSNQWNVSVDELRGKRVAIVGTGASAVQIIPEVARVAEKLYVCQRTPPWILPKHDREVATWIRWMFRHVPLLLWFWRFWLFCLLELMGSAYWGLVKPAARLRRLGEAIISKQMEKHIKDPLLRERMTPSYELGCKRVLLSSEFYPTLARPNVEVISGSLLQVCDHSVVIKTNPSRSHQESSVVVDDLDAIIYATGFDVHEPKIRIVGLNPNAAYFDKTWPTFMGVARNGYPNFFIILGANSGLGHNSQLLIIEAQASYIAKCIQLMLSTCVHYMDVKLKSQEWFQEFLAQRFPQTVWHPGGCLSWYVHTESGHNPIIWPASTLEYMYRTRRANPSDFNFY